MDWLFIPPSTASFKISTEEKGWTLRTTAQYEFTEENFTALNPYRSREFLRDWNLVNVQGIGNVEKASENILRGSIELQKKEALDVNYRVSTFNRGTIYQGVRQFGQFHLYARGWDLDLVTDYLSAREPQQNTTFSRPKVQLVKTFEKWKGWKLGGNGERERSSRFGIETDTLLGNSFYFDRYRLFLESPEQKAAQLNINFSQRFDYEPSGRDFLLNAEASELNINGGWKARNVLRLAGNFTYRNLTVKESTDLIDQSETGETFLGRTDLNLNLAKGAIRFNTTYEVGSGQEPKLEFSYIRVAQGEGTHIWLDSLFNNDGIIQPNEMEVAPFQDRARLCKDHHLHQRLHPHQQRQPQPKPATQPQSRLVFGRRAAQVPRPVLNPKYPQDQPQDPGIRRRFRLESLRHLHCRYLPGLRRLYRPQHPLL